MNIANHFRVVSHSDHVLPAPTAVRALGGQEQVDIRAWRTAPALEQLRLLVHAPRRTGKAVERNRFKRRTRMALLKVLEENSSLTLDDWVIWVRPRKGSALGCRVAFSVIEGQLRLALSRLG